MIHLVLVLKQLEHGSFTFSFESLNSCRYGLNMNNKDHIGNLRQEKKY